MVMEKKIESFHMFTYLNYNNISSTICAGLCTIFHRESFFCEHFTVSCTISLIAFREKKILRHFTVYGVR